MPSDTMSQDIKRTESSKDTHFSNTMDVSPECGITERFDLQEASDSKVLAQMGYKQELQRRYSTFSVFAIAFSIMGLLPSIAATLAFSIPAGPVGMVWGWFIPSALIFVVGLAMADLGSAFPTSGGLYWWTHYFAHTKIANPLSFVIGYSNTLGLIGGICSIDYGFALMLLSVVSIARDGEWSATSGTVYGTFAVTVFTHGLLATFAARFMPKIQMLCVYFNVGLIIATVIALPVGKHVNGSRINSAHYVFGTLENETTWPAGWAFFIAWLSPIWTIGAFDSCVHMSEEATNATKAVPIGILGSIGACWGLGFVTLIVLAFCMDPVLENTLGTPFGQPMAQIYFDCLGKNGAIGFMAAVALVQFFMGLSIVIAASRQTWAFARDGALPFSGFLRLVSTRITAQPVRTVWACCVVAILLGLICLIDAAAAGALFSLAVAGNDVAWAAPILCRIVWGNAKFIPGPFYTGRFSKSIAIVALVYLSFSIILCMFPTGGPDPTRNVMNYSIVIDCFVWGGSLLYFLVAAHKWYRGPISNLNLDNSQ